MKTKNKLTVSELNRLINTEISLSPFLQKVEVEAEIGRITKHSSGHYYFVIKDNYSSIDCIMFKSAVKNLKADFFEGDFVTLKGRISIYEQNARLQLYVNSVEQLGEGKFLKEFYELKEKLSAEGVFDSKRPLKTFPSKIALLTSKSSAAIKDYKKILKSRNPFVELIEYEINMQSNDTPSQIISALETIDISTELVVITRGGGSYEDLRYFNDELLARYISGYRIPVISAIGHEIDYTIIEFASDYRAATPSEAAVMSSGNVYEFAEEYRIFMNSIRDKVSKDVSIIKLDLSNVLDNIDFIAKKRITSTIYAIDMVKREIESATDSKVRIAKENLKNHFIHLDALNPLNIISKGYCVVTKEAQTIGSVNEVDVDDDLVLRFKDGKVVTSVREVKDELLEKN